MPQSGCGMPQGGYFMPQSGCGMPQSGFFMPQRRYFMPRNCCGIPQNFRNIPQWLYGMLQRFRDMFREVTRHVPGDSGESTGNFGGCHGASARRQGTSVRRIRIFREPGDSCRHRFPDGRILDVFFFLVLPLIAWKIPIQTNMTAHRRRNIANLAIPVNPSEIIVPTNSRQFEMYPVETKRTNFTDKKHGNDNFSYRS